MWAAMAAQAAGEIVQGVNQIGAAKRQAAVDDANAKDATNKGNAAAGLIRERAGRAAGANRAAAAASGVDVSGFNDVFDDSDISAELDAQTAIRNAKVDANNFKLEAREARRSIMPTAIGAVLGAGSKALSGYGNWKLAQPKDPSGYPAPTVNQSTGMYGRI